MDGTPINILLVEDNPDHAALVLIGLEENHIANHVTHVEDGEAALDFVFQRGRFAELAAAHRPDLILLDLRLPRVDGLEVLRILKETDATKRIPIVVLTTSDAEKDLVTAYDYHANSYLVKPINFQMFMELIKTLGYYWVAWNKRAE